MNSFGVRWAGEQLASLLRPGTPLLAIAKGMEADDDGDLRLLPDVLTAPLPEAIRSQVPVAAIVGPSIAGEVAARRDTCVVFAGTDAAALDRLAATWRTATYRVWTTTDLVGAEVCAAMKNCYALGVGLAEGVLDALGESESRHRAHNYEAALFAQGVLEMREMVAPARRSPGDRRRPRRDRRLLRDEHRRAQRPRRPAARRGGGVQPRRGSASGTSRSRAPRRSGSSARRCPGSPSAGSSPPTTSPCCATSTRSSGWSGRSTCRGSASSAARPRADAPRGSRRPLPTFLPQAGSVATRARPTNARGGSLRRLSRHVVLLAVAALLAAGAPERAGAQTGSAVPDGLPARWCGEPGGFPVGPPAAPHFRLVYAHPADRPNRFAQVAHALQADVAAISRLVAWESGWRKTLRFAMGTSCGPHHAVIDVVTLPLARAAYLDPVTGDPRVDVLAADLLPRVPPGGRSNLVVLADTLGGGRLAGVAAPSLDERPGPENAANVPGRTALVLSPDGPFTTTAGGLYAPDVLLHEVLHTLGAVGAGAPNATAGGHCTDGADVMCLDDGAGLPRPVCPRLDWAPSGRIDCGRDDYFAPDLAPSAYLQRAWNVYRSDFLGACNAELAAACGNRAFAPRELPTEPPFAPDGLPDAPAFAELPAPAALAAGPPVPTQRTDGPLRRVRRGRAGGAPLTTVRALAFHDATPPAPVPTISVRAGRLRLPAGRWRIVDCVGVTTRVTRMTDRTPRCAATVIPRLRTPRSVWPPGHEFAFGPREGMPRLAAGWTEVWRVGPGVGERLWATSLAPRRPQVLARAGG